MTSVTESDVEAAALEWLADLGWQTAYGPDIGPGGPNEERADYGVVVLERRLRDAPRAAGRRVGNCLTVGTTREEHDGAIGAA